MKNLTLKNMAQACNGTLVLPEGMSSEELEDKETTSVVIDSRKVTKDGMFVAGKCSYQVVVVPGVSNLFVNTVKLLNYVKCPYECELWQ